MQNMRIALYPCLQVSGVCDPLRLAKPQESEICAKPSEPVWQPAGALDMASRDVYLSCSGCFNRDAGGDTPVIFHYLERKSSL